MANARAENEIQELRDTLAAYHESETTAHLYELSRYLLAEIVERVSRLDSKAGRFASFSGGILALLLSTYSTWRAQIGSSLWLIALTGFAVICIGLAGWYAFRAMRVTDFDWISDRAIVFPGELLDFPDELKRYHILAIYRSVLSHQEVSEQKARYVLTSQNLFLGGAVLLAACLLGILVRPWAITLLCGLCDRLTRGNL